MSAIPVFFIDFTLIGMVLRSNWPESSWRLTFQMARAAMTSATN